jgi:hypothetical protein
MASTEAVAREIVDEMLDTAGAIRAAEEPLDLVLTPNEEDAYEMGVYFCAAAAFWVLQDRGLLRQG